MHILGTLNDSGEPEPWAPVRDSFLALKSPFLKKHLRKMWFAVLLSMDVVA
jgi:hypothetical protein